MFFPLCKILRFPLKIKINNILLIFFCIGKHARKMATSSQEKYPMHNIQTNRFSSWEMKINICTSYTISNMNEQTPSLLCMLWEELTTRIDFYSNNLMLIRVNVLSSTWWIALMWLNWKYATEVVFEEPLEVSIYLVDINLFASEASFRTFGEQ